MEEKCWKHRSTKKHRTKKGPKKKRKFFFSLDRFFVFFFLALSFWYGPYETHTKRDIIHRNQFHQNAHALETRSKQKHFLTMGITFAKLFQRLFSKKEMRILMVRANFCAFFFSFLVGSALSQRITRRQIERHSRRRWWWFDDVKGEDWILNCALGVKVVEGGTDRTKKKRGVCFRILGDPMRWNIGRLASSRGRAWLFERVECIRASVARNFFLSLSRCVCWYWPKRFFSHRRGKTHAGWSRCRR